MGSKRCFFYPVYRINNGQSLGHGEQQNTKDAKGIFNMLLQDIKGRPKTDEVR